MNLFALAAANSGDSFFQKTMKIGAIEPKIWHVIVAMAILVALIVVLIVCIAKVSKKTKRDKAPKGDERIDVRNDEEKQEDAGQKEIIDTNGVGRSDYVRVAGIKTADEKQEKVEEPDLSEISTEEPVEDEKPVEEEKTEKVEETPAVAEIAEEEKAEEDAEEVKSEEPIEEPVEEKEEPIEEQKEEAPAIEEKAEETPVEEKKEEKTEEKKAAPKKKAAKEKKPEEKEVVAAVTVEKEDKVAKEVKDAKVVGKFEICNSNLGGFNYLLKANNGQLLYESKAYKSKDSCREALDNFVAAVKEGRFVIRADKFKNYKFVLKSPTSNTLIYIGESFSTEASCKNNIESVKRFAENSPIVDITNEDFVAEFVPYEIPADIVKAVKDKTGVVGKWAIEQVEEGVKNSPYVFLLYANNGQLLFESRDYKTYANCLSGLNTFVNTVKTGVFAIDPDKSGRFKFVLRSASANSAMEYFGQNYDTKKGCANSIDSVYRFALLSPVPEK